MGRRVDVVVVGAGAMGSAAAWWLARRGRDVALLEQHEAGHHLGSSHGSTRIFRLAYADPTYVRLAQDALPLWRELEDDAGRTLLETTGGVDHGDPAELDRIASALRAGGAAVERLTAAAAAERWPGMRFAGDVVHQPDAGRCLADATVAALQQRARAHGADVRFGTGPARVEHRGDGVVVRAADEEWSAPVAVVAAGAWLPSVVGALVDLPPVRVTLEQVQHFVPRDAATDWPSFIHHAPIAHYGLASPEGVKVAEHHTGDEADPDTRRVEPDPARAARVARYVAEWFPGVDPEPVAALTCLYTTTPTHDFVLDRIGPIVVASPCSGHGFKFTPVLGRLIADLAAGDTSSVPARFRRPRPAPGDGGR